MSSLSDSLIVTSPTLSASSLSSSGFDFVAVGRQLETPNSRNNAIVTTPISVMPNLHMAEESSLSDDEIVWSVSESEELEDPTAEFEAVLSDEDFVVLGRSNQPRSQVRARTPRYATSQTGTVRGASSQLELENHFLAEIRDFTTEGMALIDEQVASELGEALAELKLDANLFSGEAKAMKTPYNDEIRDADTPGTFPRHISGPYKRGQNTGLLTKTRKKKEKKQKKEGKGKKDEGVGKPSKSKKEKKSRRKRKTSGEASTTTPVAKVLPLPPQLAKSVSTATIVPSPDTINNSSTPQPPSALNVVATKADVPSADHNTFSSFPPEKVKPLVNAPSEPQKKKKKKKGKKGKIIETVHSPAITQSNIVDAEKVTEQSQQTSDKTATTAYDEAVGYITSYISTTSAHQDRICHLTLLQSLIIELGLTTDLTLLPTSVTSAKKYIKAHMFLNIKEYLAKRHQGAEVVQGLLFPSRSALVKDMKRKKNFASLQWVKEQGLQDLLVGVFHR